MSRTTRKKHSNATFEYLCFTGITDNEFWNYKGLSEKKLKGYFNTDNYKYSYRYPKYYRKETNRKRKSIDKQALYREVKYGTEELYCLWNCKTSDPWWFW